MLHYKVELRESIIKSAGKWKQIYSNCIYSTVGNFVRTGIVSISDGCKPILSGNEFHYFNKLQTGRFILTNFKQNSSSPAFVF